MNDYIEVVATATCVLANESLLVCLIDGSLQLDLLVPELTSNVDVGCLGAHAEADYEGAFDKLVRVVSQDLTVLAGARLRLVGVDHKIGWSMKNYK